jgi:uncharacterized membrane protein
MFSFNYAFSDGLVALAAICAAVLLMRHQKYWGTIGVLCFGVAAAIGTYRFAFGLVDELAVLHRNVSQLGGIVGLGLIIVEVFFMIRSSKVKPIGPAIIFALFLANAFFIRRSEFLGPDLSWHLFHTITAVWLVLVAYTLTKKSAKPQI